jgi:hypothetical protein
MRVGWLLLVGFVGCPGSFMISPLASPADAGQPADAASRGPVRPPTPPDLAALPGGAGDLQTPADLAPPVADLELPVWDMGRACVNGTTATDSGHHNAGFPCLDCHTLLGAPRFSVAGTLYDALAGGNPVAGATIEIIDATQNVVRLTSEQNGNFWTPVPLVFPLYVRATSCPTSTAMPTPVMAGNCNMMGCHDTQQRVHLP